MFLQATLADGGKVVSEFSKLGRVERYVNQVFTGAKPFNAWKVVGTEHPHSGERVLIRTRAMLNGTNIVSIEEVEVKPEIGDNHQYLPENFLPKASLQKGQYGFWTAPEDGSVENAVAGAQYPVRKDEATLRRYVILRVGDPSADPSEVASQEIRHFLDAERAVFSNDYGDGRRSSWDEEADSSFDDDDF